MKPTSIGDLTSKQETNASPETPIQFSDSETRLLYQEFLMKPNTRVLDFLTENHAIVHDFVRFQCGEVIENDDK
jgi:translation elongation factor EF-Ts